MNHHLQSSATSTPPVFPSRPRLVLRVGFAGSQRLVTDQELDAQTLPDDEMARTQEQANRVAARAERRRLERALPHVLEALGHTLAAIAPRASVTQVRESRVDGFYSSQCPLLRLVTGLCEGADALAAQLLDRVNIATDSNDTCGANARCLETELAAVIPFAVETYRRSRPDSFQGEFDRQLASCAWVLELDGIYEKPVSDTTEAKKRRARVYRAQSSFLLRQSDILIAAANPDRPSKPGGTLETVREALAFGLPIVFIHTGLDDDNVFLIDPLDDMYSILTESPQSRSDWKSMLRAWVTEITVAPDAERNPGESSQEQAIQHGAKLLAEFFDHPELPPRDARGQRRNGCREWAWSWFEKRFRPKVSITSDPPLAPFSIFRKRATDLNAHYSGQYRGAFLLNYSLAIVAVVLAAFSLTLLGVANQSSHVTLASTAPTAWLLPVLLLLAAVKLGIVAFIASNTRRANRDRWNDRAVDYRYLAERLRGMYYLPLAGCHQPPAAAPPQFASRVVRQSAMDWLFDAIVRAISPADMPHAHAKTIPAHNGKGTVTVRKLVTLDPRKTAAQVRDAWIGEQAKYHDRNARTMHAMHHRMEQIATLLSWSVIAVVGFDLLLIGGKILHWLPESCVPFAKAATPWMIFISAVLPAAVAALGGIRFQSECQRLAERSAVMRTMLAGRGLRESPSPGGRWELADTLVQRLDTLAQSPATDPGSAAHEVLRLTERVANDFVQEAAEWSVLYAKEVSDPG